MPRALLSVSDKTNLVPFARALHQREYELVSTGGTARTLSDAGLPVIAIADVTGMPEMMGGRVKTLHPRVHGGILARRTNPDDLAAAVEHGITLIDLVIVNLYPFAAAAANPQTSFDALVEEIDIGGPSLVRGAAKNFRDVLVVVSPHDYEAVIAQLDGGVTAAFRLSLAQKAFDHTALYDSEIASSLLDVRAADEGYHRTPRSGMPARLPLRLTKRADLRYGENPHQPAAWYVGGVPAHPANRGEDGGTRTGFGAARLLQGKELSYTNLLDLDAAARIVIEFDEPAATVIKHTNPSGVATGASLAEAYVRAREADPVSAFGGIVGLNRVIDLETATAIAATKIDAVVAPDVAEDALAILAKKGAMRVVIADLSPASAAGVDLRSILGGVLAQERDRVVEASMPWPSGALRVVTTRQPTAAEWQALRFAWRVCAHVKSNTVIFTGGDRTLAMGAGQMSRVDAVNVARMKATAANISLAGSVAASDAFIPFRDGLDAIAAAGARAVVQPGGSLKDPEVIAAADEQGLAMVFTGRRHFRH
jgi:phosphoribosylaminoimidazolecarboxamide formyltransferase/IMP cyclohydrolase